MPKVELVKSFITPPEATVFLDVGTIITLNGFGMEDGNHLALMVGRGGHGSVVFTQLNGNFPGFRFTDDETFVPTMMTLSALEEILGAKILEIIPPCKYNLTLEY